MNKNRIVKSGKIIILIFTFIYIVVGIYIGISGLSDNYEKADVMVVLGNEVEASGEPSERLKARLNKAMQLYNDGYSQKIIVSGGIDTRGIDEAIIMKGYLEENGIPESAIIVDNLGYDTYLSAQNTSRLMQENGWTKVIIVTQFFHIARSRLAFTQFKVPIVYFAHADYFELRDIYSTAREVVAIIYYWVRSY
jgi:vancomycin permeability regulator SanA